MRIICSTILELREYEDKRIVCQVKLTPKKLQASNDKIHTAQSFHWLAPEDKRTFDMELQKIVAKLSHDCQHHLDQKFDLSDSTRLHVKQSRTPVQALLDILGCPSMPVFEKIWVLECNIDSQENCRAIGKSTTCNFGSNSKKSEVEIFSSQDSLYCETQLESSISESIEPSLIYVPSPIKSQNEGSVCTITTPEKDCYSPTNDDVVNQPSYNPSPITYGTNFIGFSDEDRYSPTVDDKFHQPSYEPSPISKKRSPSVFSDSIHEDRYSPTFGGDFDQPMYKASPIKRITRSAMKNDKSSFSDSEEEKLDTHTKYIKKKKLEAKPETPQRNSNSGAKQKITKSKKSRERSSSNSPQLKEKTSNIESDYCQENLKDKVDKIEQAKKPKDKNVKHALSKHHNIEYKSDKKIENANVKKIGSKPFSKYDNKLLSPLRRSSRSPNKVKRLIEEASYAKISTGAKHKKKDSMPSKRLNRELFGSGEESDDFDKGTPVKNAPKKDVPQIVKSKKRKRSKKLDCSQEQSTIGRWLSKNPNDSSSHIKPLKVTTHKSKHEKEFITKSKDTYPTQEEIDRIKEIERERMESNKQMKQMLEDMLEAQKPKKVDILSLNSMSTNEILATFKKHKRKLDAIFEQYRRKPNVKSYNGINHYTVINLIDIDKEREMMLKLGEVYETDTEGSSLYTKLFTNAMMPVWLVNIFKDKFDLSYEGAIIHLKAQGDYQDYLDSLQDD